MRPITSIPNGNLFWVSDIIDETSASWKTDLIRTTFLPMDALVILSIPLCTRSMPDFWSWAFEKNGSFSVRSAYRMLVKTKMNREGWLFHDAGPSTTAAETRDWTDLWGIQVPSKIQIFLWRLSHHSLPTFDVLEHRNMAVEPYCVLCGRPDSWRHALLDCSMSRCVWALSKPELVEHMISTTEANAKQWLFSLHSSLSHGEFTAMVITLWSIWFARRKAIYDHEFQSPQATHMFAKSFFAELTTLEGRRGSIQRQHSLVRQHTPWVPPPLGVAQLNVDGAVASRAGRGAAAVVCRYANGHYLGSSSTTYEGILDPTTL